jgi:hypothetical protein
MRMQSRKRTFVLRFPGTVAQSETPVDLDSVGELRTACTKDVANVQQQRGSKYRRHDVYLLTCSCVDMLSAAVSAKQNCNVCTVCTELLEGADAPSRCEFVRELHIHQT